MSPQDLLMHSGGDGSKKNKFIQMCRQQSKIVRVDRGDHEPLEIRKNSIILAFSFKVIPSPYEMAVLPLLGWWESYTGAIYIYNGSNCKETKDYFLRARFTWLPRRWGSVCFISFPVCSFSQLRIDSIICDTSFTDKCSCLINDKWKPHCLKGTSLCFHL